MDRRAGDKAARLVENHAPAREGSDGDYASKALERYDGRFHMAGDQLTYWSGWLEGALIGALTAVQAVDRQAPAAIRRG